jgi:hypothetical protein
VKAEEVIEGFVLSFGIVTPRQGLLTIKSIITACLKEACNTRYIFLIEVLFNLSINPFRYCCI